MTVYMGNPSLRGEASGRRTYETGILIAFLFLKCKIPYEKKNTEKRAMYIRVLLRRIFFLS
jgi:hypothetical protein